MQSKSRGISSRTTSTMQVLSMQVSATTTPTEVSDDSTSGFGKRKRETTTLGNN